ncbi:lipase [Rhizobium ruizarguesonis]|nr:lipase [Rhizobium ruizarguesonis]NKJ76589.1 lipase [Rhizobium leguminosarum bv. viciae]MBC2802205.1 lipase [Rhizobium ruizarguesonis]NKQ73244.1 lipase [Rhizobium ruizarguesonis]NKQ80663.1 lipase [Rhizobium ruizarguesonis]TAX79304.1 lipase [Rhizobium ruizarguesonis]
MNDTVLLFHGIARTKKSMAKLAGFLSGHGYRVVNVGYPSTKFSISERRNGSQIADFLKNWPLYRKVYGPAGQQLITDQAAMTELFGTVDYELGIIAGNRTIDPVSSLIIGLRVPNDGKVSVESTRLDGASAHIVIPANHTFLPVNKVMWSQTLSFLQHGRFTS